MKTFFKIIGAIFLLIILGIAGIIAFNWEVAKQIWRFSPVVIPAMYGEPADETEAREQDIRFLRKFLNYDRSFSESERAEFTEYVNGLADRTATMSAAELYLGASHAAAIADNGHTGASAGPLYREFNRIGVKMYWFADGLFVVRADAKNTGLVGMRVVQIEGRDIDSVEEALQKYTGGVPQWRKLYSSLFMGSPEIMNAAGLAASANELSMTLVDANGEERTATLAGSNTPGQADLPSRRPWETLKAITLPDEGDTWRRTLSFDGETAPYYLRNIEENFYRTKIDNGVYLRPQLLLESEETPIVSNFEAVLAGAADTPYDFMIVDLRWSPGGDYTKVIDFVKAAPDAIRDNGQLYIVVGPQTFSAAVVTTAFLKYYGGDKSVIVGTPMGDGEIFWAERGPLPFKLPNSGYSIGFATGYHDWANGCAGKHRYCFTQNLIHEVPAGSLLPDVVIDPSYEEYASGNDIVMDWILDQETETNGAASDN